MPLGGYTGAGGTGRVVSRKQYKSCESGFESTERDSQFNTAGGSKFQVRGRAVLNDRPANDVKLRLVGRSRSLAVNKFVRFYE